MRVDMRQMAGKQRASCAVGGMSTTASDFRVTARSLAPRALHALSRCRNVSTAMMSDSCSNYGRLSRNWLVAIRVSGAPLAKAGVLDRGRGRVVARLDL